MKASTVIIMVLILDTMLFFGTQVENDILGTTIEDESGDRPINKMWETDPATGELQNQPNATFWGEIAELDLVGAGFVILGGNSIAYNTVTAIGSAINFFINILFAPWQIATLYHLNEFPFLAELFTILMIAMHSFALWQIFSGRNV